MKFEFIKHGYFDLVIINGRYMLLSLIFPICFIANDFFRNKISIDTLRVSLIIIAIAVIATLLQAYRIFNVKGSSYLELSTESLSIVYGKSNEVIPLTEISKCIVFNICGSKNFVLWYSGKTTGISLNDVSKEFVPEISKLLSGVEVKKASIFETLKYVFNPNC